MPLDFNRKPSTMSAKQRMMQAAQSNVKDRVVEIPLNKLCESPLNKNMPLDDIEGLAESIKENGLQEALLVYEKTDEYEIYAGHRRFHAAQLLGMTTIPCIVKKYPEDPAVRFKEHFINNSERRENGFSFWLAEIIAARETLVSTGFSGTKREQVDTISKMLDGKLSIAQIYRYEAVEKSPHLIELAELGYSVYTLYQLNGLSEDIIKTFAEKVKEETDINGLLSNHEFSMLLEKVKSQIESPNEEKQESETKKPVNAYENKLMKLETKIGKLYHPKTDEEREMARASILRIRTLLNELEQSL